MFGIAGLSFWARFLGSSSFILMAPRISAAMLHSSLKHPLMATIWWQSRYHLLICPGYTSSSHSNGIAFVEHTWASTPLFRDACSVSPSPALLACTLYYLDEKLQSARKHTAKYSGMTSFAGITATQSSQGRGKLGQIPSFGDGVLLIGMTCRDDTPATMFLNSRNSTCHLFHPVHISDCSGYFSMLDTPTLMRCYISIFVLLPSLTHRRV